MSNWIEIDERMQEGLKILNQVENNKLRPLVNRICQAMKSGNEDKIFNQEEEEKLTASLVCEKSDLDVLLQTLISIFAQASFHLIKAPAMEARMKQDFSLDEDKIAILTHAWITHSDELVESQKQKSIFPNQVSDISWRVDVRAASTYAAREAKPIAKVQLRMENSEVPNVSVEMDKHQLWDLYNKLDDIQSQLDSLKKEK